MLTFDFNIIVNFTFILYVNYKFMQSSTTPKLEDTIFQIFKLGSGGMLHKLVTDIKYETEINNDVKIKETLMLT